jgi:hypothetical protein
VIKWGLYDYFPKPVLVGNVFLILQKFKLLPNAGEVVVICAQRRNLNYSGHICAVVTETDKHNGEWSHGEVVKLLENQAGSKNFIYTTEFRNLGFWKHV